MSTYSQIVKYQNLENKHGKKTILWILQVSDWEDCSQDNLNMAKKRQPQKRSWISYNSSSKLCHKNQFYQSEN